DGGRGWGVAGGEGGGAGVVCVAVEPRRCRTGARSRRRGTRSLGSGGRAHAGRRLRANRRAIERGNVVVAEPTAHGNGEARGRVRLDSADGLAAPPRASGAIRGRISRARVPPRRG